MAHILVVDDDPDILRLMQFTLKNAQHTVTTAADGPTALAEIQAKPPDLIIADVMMPKMTGYQFTEKVRQIPGMGKLPILVYSARFQPIDQETALNAGATDYIPKTVSPKDIIGKVNELLESTENSVKPNTGKAIAFFSLRGGVGVSTLAVNVATVLALSKKMPIALADLHTLAGHAGLMLGIRAQKSLADLRRDPTPLSDEQVDLFVARHNTGVHLLASPLVYNAEPPHHSLATVVQQLKLQFPYSIFDLPSALTPDLEETLSLFDHIVLVCAPDLPALQSAAVSMKTLPSLGVLPEKIHPVFNMNMTPPGLKKTSIEKTLRQPVYAEIPFEPQMVAAISGGKPLAISNPQAATTTAIAQLTAKLLKE